MNKLLKQIKENKERFEKDFMMDSNGGIICREGDEDNLTDYYYLRKHIIHSRIKELEVLIEMIENQAEKAGESYNPFFFDIRKLFKDTIKQLKKEK